MVSTAAHLSAQSIQHGLTIFQEDGNQATKTYIEVQGHNHYYLDTTFISFDQGFTLSRKPSIGNPETFHLNKLKVNVVSLIQCVNVYLFNL